MIDLCVIHFTSGTDETRVLRVAMNDEPRVHSDAMPSNAWAGLQDIHPGMPIGESDHFPHIQIKAIGDHWQLIGNGHLQIAIAVFDHDRKSVVEGKSVSVSVDIGGRRIIKKKKE